MQITVAMRLISRRGLPILRGLQLDQKYVVDQQVHEILAYQDVSVVYLGTALVYLGTPSVLSTENAPPITRLDSSFSSLLSAVLTWQITAARGYFPMHCP